MTEFVTNNNELDSTKLSLFFATKDFYLRMSFNIVDLSDISTHERIFKQKALDISRKMETTWEFAQKALAAAQKSQSKQADKH